MSGVEIGPSVLSGDRAAVLAGLAIFFVATGIMARRRGVASARWSPSVVIAAAVAARLAFVALHWESFAVDPLSVFAFWQGGFTWQAGAVAAVFVTGRYLWREPEHARPAIFAIAIALAGWHVTNQLHRAIDAPTLPQEALPLLAGGMIDLSERDGRPLVVNLWATWCPPCVREMPMMVEVAAGQEAVDVVFANQGEGPDRIRRFFELLALEPELVVVDQGQILFRHYSALGLPATIFIGPDGRVEHVHVGEISRAQFVSQLRGLQGS
jgi:thiol-disulfide isomerase/thioredoxin